LYLCSAQRANVTKTPVAASSGWSNDTRRTGARRNGLAIWIRCRAPNISGGTRTPRPPEPIWQRLVPRQLSIEELALRPIERSLSSHRSDRRSDVALRIWDYLAHRPCRKRGRSRRICAVGRITKTDEKATTTSPSRRRVIRLRSPRGSRSRAKKAIGAEAKKGYGLLFIGREPASEGDTFHEQITHSAAKFGGPFAIAIARGVDRQEC